MQRFLRGGKEKKEKGRKKVSLICLSRKPRLSVTSARACGASVHESEAGREVLDTPRTHLKLLLLLEPLRALVELAGDALALGVEQNDRVDRVQRLSHR